MVQDAIEAGIFNDLGSGSNVDVVVINSEKVEVLRNYGRPNERGVKEARYRSGYSSDGVYCFLDQCAMPP